MSKRTLIILSPGFPGDEAESTCLPGQQVFVKALRKADPELNIIILAFQYPYKRATYQWNGVTVISFNGRNRGNIFRRILWSKVGSVIRSICRELNVIGILNFWLGECAYVSSRVATKFPLKEYHWILGQDARADNAYFTMIHPLPTSLIAISDAVSDEIFTNYGIRPAHIIPIGVDINMFADSNLSRNMDILGVGSLIPLKRYDLFIKLVAEAKRTFPEISAVICGDGGERIKLEQAITSYRLDTNIELKGEVPHADIIELMHRSKIILHTSSYEGFSSVCAEALYAGAHVISFCKPMHQGFNHWHVVRDYGEMYNKLIELLGKSIIHERVLTYDADESAKKILKLFI